MKNIELNQNPFTIDQLSEEDEPIIIDDIKKESLFKSMF
jgi:hypothetical protein